MIPIPILSLATVARNLDEKNIKLVLSKAAKNAVID